MEGRGEVRKDMLDILDVSLQWQLCVMDHCCLNHHRRAVWRKQEASNRPSFIVFVLMPITWDIQQGIWLTNCKPTPTLESKPFLCKLRMLASNNQANTWQTENIRFSCSMGYTLSWLATCVISQTCQLSNVNYLKNNFIAVAASKVGVIVVRNSHH